MAKDIMDDAKIAADAVLLVPKLARENAGLREKVARYERKERIEKIADALIDKKQIELHERTVKIAELAELPDADLGKIESALPLISPSGSIKLGTVEGGAQQGGTVPQEDAFGRFERFLLTGGEASGE